MVDFHDVLFDANRFVAAYITNPSEGRYYISIWVDVEPKMIGTVPFSTHAEAQEQLAVLRNRVDARRG